MTALKEYARLESTGVWRESPATQRRDVMVSFGESTLVMSDRNDQALAHWSLAAVQRLNPGKLPAVYSPGPDATESLEVEDATMVAAIEKVRALIARRRPQPGRLRVWSLGAIIAGVAALAFLWLPGALLRHTVAVLPPAARQEVGLALLENVTRISGRPCASARGTAALDRLSRRLLGTEGGTVVVVPGGVRFAQSLPGGLILVNRNLVEDFETPEVLAGFILAEADRRARTDPMEALLQAAGPRATIRLLTTGHLPEESLDAHAERLLSAPDLPATDIALLERFAAAKVPSTPYALALDVTGESTVTLIEADPMKDGGALPVLSDADWVSLQGICGE